MVGYGIGFLLGLVAGGQNLGYSRNFEFGKAIGVGVIAGIPFALIGGGLGSLFAEDKFYDLSSYSHIKKRNKIYYLMEENPDR